jgi:1,4-alpha-glucan branching enzyme
MSKVGAFTFVLHSHLPYARQAGRWPHGEEWLHEAAAETYIPLLNTLTKLHDEKIDAKLTISLTPILLEQLADDDIKTNFITYLDERIAAAEDDIERFASADQQHMQSLAVYYRDWYQSIRMDFTERYMRDLVGAFRQFQKAGMIEILTCAATHAYLPLLSRDGSIRLQLRTAVNAYQRHFGRKPAGIWLPECAYRPAFTTEEGTFRTGIESFLQENGLKLFFTETHMIEGGNPVGIAAGEVLGPYGVITRRYVVPLTEDMPSEPATTYLPYFVGQSDVAVIGRNNQSGLQVWSADWGYPGDFDYREFHKKDGISGMQYWRVTGADTTLGDKEPYHPDWAAGKVEQHADHFVELVTGLLEGYHHESDQYGLISANYDTELFGHWWFEGVAWIEAVLRRLAKSEQVELMTATDYLRSHPPQHAINLPEGSWGAGGTHFVWDNDDTHWMWPIIHEAEARMATAIETYPRARGAVRKQLNQAARELLLLQSSDWPFLVTTAQAREYAIQRFQQHVERFNHLLGSLEAGHPDAVRTAEFYERDKVFPKIDFRWFRP